VVSSLRFTKLIPATRRRITTPVLPRMNSPRCSREGLFEEERYDMLDATYRIL
jgi:hypothetical protein